MRNHCVGERDIADGVKPRSKSRETAVKGETFLRPRTPGNDPVQHSRNIDLLVRYLTTRVIHCRFTLFMASTGLQPMDSCFLIFLLFILLDTVIY